MRDEAKQGDGESGSRPDRGVIDRSAIHVSHVDVCSVETSDDFHVRRRDASPRLFFLYLKIRQAFYRDYLIDYAETRAITVFYFAVNAS